MRRGVKGGGEEFEITTQTEGTEPSGQSTWPTTSCWAQNRLTNQLCGHFLDYITPQPLLSPMYSLDYRAINLDPRPRTYIIAGRLVECPQGVWVVLWQLGSKRLMWVLPSPRDVWSATYGLLSCGGGRDLNAFRLSTSYRVIWWRYSVAASVGFSLVDTSARERSWRSVAMPSRRYESNRFGCFVQWTVCVCVLGYSWTHRRSDAVNQ